MREPDRWVVDTHVLISRLLAPSGVAAQAVDKALQTGVLLVSSETLEELANVLARPRFDSYVSALERQQFFRLLAGVSRQIPISQRVQACRDPRDDKFLDLALAGDAQAIISGDKDLLALHPFHGVPVRASAAFLAL